MKNIITTIYTTIFSLLLITVFFTIAELNIIAKTSFTNQLEQSVVMNASYLLSCKLIIQIILTYVFGNILYNNIKVSYNNKISSVPQPIAPDDTYKSVKYDGVDYNLTDTQIKYKELYDKVNTIQFDPIDQIDALDKNGIKTDSGIARENIAYATHMLGKKIDEGILLCDILYDVKKPSHTFKREDIEENKRWKEVMFKDLPSKMSAYEVVVKDKKNKYYVKVN